MKLRVSLSSEPSHLLPGLGGEASSHHPLQEMRGGEPRLPTGRETRTQPPGWRERGRAWKYLPAPPPGAGLKGEPPPAPDPDVAAEDPGGGGGRGRPGTRGQEPAAHVFDHGRGGGAAPAHVLAHLPPGAVRAARPTPPAAAAPRGRASLPLIRSPARGGSDVAPTPRPCPPRPPPAPPSPRCRDFQRHPPLCRAAAVPETINGDGNGVRTSLWRGRPAGGRPGPEKGDRRGGAGAQLGDQKATREPRKGLMRLHRAGQ